MHSKPRVTSQHCSPEKMEKARKELKDFVGRSRPSTSIKDSADVPAPGTSSSSGVSAKSSPFSSTVLKGKDSTAGMDIQGFTPGPSPSFAQRPLCKTLTFTK